MHPVNIPIKAYLITLFDGDKAFAPNQDQASLGASVAGANAYWNQAKIQFQLVSTEASRCEYRGTNGVVDDTVAGILLATHATGAGVTVLAVGRTQNAEGAAYESGRTCILPTTPGGRFAGRLLAHELGHLLGLDDIALADMRDQRRLFRLGKNMMWASVTHEEFQLTDRQIAHARKSRLARKFGGR